ncbi:regulatory protein RecX [Gaetbulibacter saemankumensis]|uniref:regulatory protein RecX n=1 Tax=Gaetbulibacter saemankumensis TaxID=311208 RepID=UPI000406535C|nr:regulatory protein RecX [Gaetbulibacter saemankumensis]
MHQKTTFTLDEAIQKLEYYCAYQERCHQEVVKKLEGMHMIPEAIDVVVVHLIENNFLNESRFAQTFVSGKFRIKHWGRRRINVELKRRGLSTVIINQALNTIDEFEYLNLFSELAERKVASIRETNILKKKKKFVDYFLYRGWESHLVYSKANELIK